MQQTKINSLCARENLLKGKAEYNSPPCANSIRLPAFDIASITYFFTKKAIWMRKLTISSLPILLVFPGRLCQLLNGSKGKKDDL